MLLSQNKTCSMDFLYNIAEMGLTKHLLRDRMFWQLNSLLLFGVIPKRPKGLPCLGSRRSKAARGFKSLSLRHKTSTPFGVDVFALWETVNIKHNTLQTQII